MKKNLIKDTINETPDYYCTWQTQLFRTSDGGPVAQRENITEQNLFGNGEYEGWAYFYEEAKKDLFIVMDDSWDVPIENYEDYYGCQILNAEKFPNACKGNSPGESLKALSDRIKSAGWKGLGGWICAQECERFFDGDIKKYWKERFLWAKDAGISYWKVDWGGKKENFEFRKMLTDMGHEIAPELTIEQAICPENIEVCDAFRTYDVPAIMSIPRTIRKTADALMNTKKDGYKGIINCEDEAYFAAALGCSMGIMRHPMSGNLPDGRPDPSFPAIHRNLKTKITEVTRAVRWHRMAPAFGVYKEETFISDNTLRDFWKIENQVSEVEAWWGYKDGDIMEDSAPAVISRSMELPEVIPNKDGAVPYVAASQNPNGTVSVITMARTLDRSYFIPKCTVKISGENAHLFGVFGEYEKLVIKLSYDTENVRVYAQDIADAECRDITELVTLSDGELIIDGELIHRMGTKMNGEGDTSEPGLAILVE